MKNLFRRSRFFLTKTNKFPQIRSFGIKDDKDNQDVSLAKRESVLNRSKMESKIEESEHPFDPNPLLKFQTDKIHRPRFNQTESQVKANSETDHQQKKTVDKNQENLEKKMSIEFELKKDKQPEEKAIQIKQTSNLYW